MTNIKKMAKYLRKNQHKLHTRQSLMKALKCTHSSSMGGNWVGNYLLRGIKGGVFVPVGRLGRQEVFRISANWSEKYIHECLSKGGKIIKLPDYKFFRVDSGETDWWLARDLEQLKQAHISLYGVTLKDLPKMNFKELTDKEVDELSFRDTERTCEPLVPARQMAIEYLKDNIKGKDVLPYMIASTCF